MQPPGSFQNLVALHGGGGLGLVTGSIVQAEPFGIVETSPEGCQRSHPELEFGK